RGRGGFVETDAGIGPTRIKIGGGNGQNGRHAKSRSRPPGPFPNHPTLTPTSLLFYAYCCHRFRHRGGRVTRAGRDGDGADHDHASFASEGAGSADHVSPR